MSNWRQAWIDLRLAIAEGIMVWIVLAVVPKTNEGFPLVKTIAEYLLKQSNRGE